MRAIEATTIIGRNVKPEAKKLDEILWELIAPHNPRFSEQFLVEKYGFPVVSLTDIDGEWI